MSPRTGGPKSTSPRDNQYRLRMTTQELERLEYCCAALNMSKAQVMRAGLEMVYREALKAKK